MYVAHVVIGMGLLEAMGYLNNQSIYMAVFSALCFVMAAIPCAMIWNRHFKHGPLEWVMRILTR
jgi:uncharacterized membrane protein YeiB